MTKINENLYIDFGKAYSVSLENEKVWIEHHRLSDYSGEEAKQVWAAFLRWQEGQK